MTTPQKPPAQPLGWHAVVVFALICATICFVVWRVTG